jgi:hypothetical protein
MTSVFPSLICSEQSNVVAARLFCQLSLHLIRLLLLVQRDDKGFFEAEATGNGEDGTEAREHGSKQNDLPHTRVHGQIGEMVTERGQILLTIKSIL